MIKINRHNYEVYFVDYMEGNLNDSQKDEFLQFLESNPDLKEELQDWEEVKIPPTRKVHFPDKNILKKTAPIFPKDSPFEELCIAKLEGDLTQENQSLFDEYIKDEPGKNKTYELYGKTKLQPDYSISFPEKEKLKAKHEEKTKVLYRPNYQTIIAFAASIALIFGLFFNNLTDNSGYYDKYTNLNPIKQDIAFNKPLSNTNYTFNSNNINNIKDLPIENSNLLPIAKIKNADNINSSHNSISKLESNRILEWETLNKKIYTANIIKENYSQDVLLTGQVKKLKNISSTHKNTATKPPKLTDINKERSNRLLLDIADIGFKGLSKLTGKEIDLKRSYTEKGKLKNLAFKTESFSISTEISE